MSAAAAPRFDLAGVGSPIVDLLAAVPPAFLATHVAGEPGGMVLVEAAEIERLLALLPAPPASAAGGSAANTAMGAARLGLAVTFVGKVGADATAAAYRRLLAATGTDASRLKSGPLPNARCLSLVTPDGARTMRTCLGAALTLAPDEVAAADFAGCRLAHMEGYLLFNPALADAVLAAIRAAGAGLSLDVGSFEVVAAARAWILRTLAAGAEVVFANEDEARALFPDLGSDYPAHARRLAAHGALGVVKLGAAGALVARGDAVTHVPAAPVARVVDTTGAGDAFAAGFLAAHLRGATPAAAATFGALLGARCVEVLGAALPDAAWPDLRARLP